MSSCRSLPKILIVTPSKSVRKGLSSVGGDPPIVCCVNARGVTS
jgi:hypothetical protein